MNARTLFLIALVAGLATVACQVSAAGAGSLSEKEMAALKSVVEPYEAAMTAMDWAAVAAFYTEDALRMPPNADIQKGRAAIEKGLGAMPGKVIEFSLELKEIDGHDGMAYSWGTYAITLDVEGKPDPVSDNGKWLNISRKQKDGSWLISRSIWNSNVPLPGKEPEK